jgi:hypothetical protein
VLFEILGEELLGHLVGLPAVSISQAADEGQVTDRLAWIGQVVWCLQGAYNNSGIRRWFTRTGNPMPGPQ